MKVRPYEAANAMVAVARTATTRRVLSEESRCKALLQRWNAAHAGKQGLGLGGLHIIDESVRVGRHGRFLMDERDGHRARIVVVGRVPAVDPQDHEFHLEPLGEGAES